MSVRWMVRWRRGRHTIPELPVRRRGKRLTLAGLVCGLVAVTVPVAVWAGTPGSDPGLGQWVGGKVLAPGPEPLVLWKLPGASGVYGTCIDARAAGPLHGPYVREQVIADPVYGELNHLYATASTSDVQLAELSALNSSAYDRVDRNVQWSYVVNKQGGLSVADAGAMLDRAKQLAGPYRMAIAVPSGVIAGSVYTAKVTVVAASGARVPGASLTFAATNATLGARTVTTNGLGHASVTFTVPRGTTTSFALRASVQSWTNVAVYAAPGEQHMLSAGPPTTQTVSASGPIVRDRDVSLVKAAAGDPAHTPVPGYSYRISDSAGHVVVPSVVSGTAPVGIGRLTMGATYMATEIGTPANATLYIPVQNTTTFTVPVGTAVWTLLAQDPRMPTPALGTQASAEHATVGDVLTDVVTVSGDDGEDGTIDAVRYGPAPPPASGNCADVTLAVYLAAPAVHVQAAVSGAANRGNGQVRITSPAVTAPGCYGWAEKLTLRPSGATATSPPTAPHESTLVVTPAKPPVHPTPPHSVSPRQPVVPRPPAPHTPLAATGITTPVAATVVVGLGLVGAGALALLAAARRGRRA